MKNKSIIKSNKRRKIGWKVIWEEREASIRSPRLLEMFIKLIFYIKIITINMWSPILKQHILLLLADHKTIITHTPFVYYKPCNQLKQYMYIIFSFCFILLHGTLWLKKSIRLQSYNPHPLPWSYRSPKFDVLWKRGLYWITNSDHPTLNQLSSIVISMHSTFNMTSWQMLCPKTSPTSRLSKVCLVV